MHAHGAGGRRDRGIPRRWAGGGSVRAGCSRRRGRGPRWRRRCARPRAGGRPRRRAPTGWRGSSRRERALIDGAESQLADTFAALAQETLRASQEDFLTLANERLGAVREQTTIEAEARQAAQQQAIEGMVAPVRASLEKVDEQIRAMERERGTAYGELRQQLETVTETQAKLHDATGSLVSALKAPAVRGRWGEMQLRRVVELAGMLEHCDFEEQATIAGDDGRLRPDMIVSLPGGRRIVVDAKAPLGAYLEAREAPDDETRAAKYRQHAAAGARARHEAGREELLGRARRRARHGRDVPARRAALQRGAGADAGADRRGRGAEGADRDADDAARRCCARPASAGARRGWRRTRERIADEGRKLHERIATVLEHFSQLGRALGQSVKHFNAAMVSFDREPGQLGAPARGARCQGEEGAPDRAQIDARRSR